MKKILLTLLVMLCVTCSAYAKYTPIDFIYLHGADQGTEQEFIDWMAKLHPDMKRNFEKSEFAKQHFLKDAVINPTPDMVYWADKTAQSKSIIEEGLRISKKQSNFISQGARELLAHLLHDAIWLQKSQNMKPITDELNRKVIENYKRGEKSFLVGYSAGTFITYQYVVNKSRFLNPREFLEKYYANMITAKDFDYYMKNYVPKTTCIDAMIDSGLTLLNTNGELILTPDINDRKAAAKKIKAQTELSCMPDGALAGALNFGSPIVIFYSELGNKQSQTSYFTQKAMRYLVNNNIFFLTDNYSKDPFGIPIANITYYTIKNFAPDIKQTNGFIYSAITPGGINSAAAHLKYWDNTDSYTKSVVKNYEAGYKYFYGVEDTKGILKK